MKSVSVVCKHCSSVFEARPAAVNRGDAKFCSISCGASYHGIRRVDKTPNAQCAQCQTSIYINKKRREASKSGLFFCNMKCKYTAQRIGGIKEIMPAHYGTGNSPYYYRKQAFENHEAKCGHCGWDKYKEVLHVHHMDRDRNNNTPENLMPLCPTCHEVEHYLSGDGRFYARTVDKPNLDD
jgi:hypothetical protein